MARDYPIISADSHLQVAPERWTGRIPEKYRDLAPRTVPWPEPGVATALRVPWDEPGAAAEAACLPADMCVGPPVALGLAGEAVAHPNPDLSLRFAGPVKGTAVIGVGRTARVHAGLATVSIQVWSASGLVALGISSSMLLGSG